MTAPFLAPGGFVRYLDTAGLVMPFGKLYFYETETLDEADVYDADGNVLAQPVTADITGKFEQVYLSDLVTYRVRILSADDVEQFDIDPYSSQSGGGADPFNPLSYPALVDGNDITEAVEYIAYTYAPELEGVDINIPPGLDWVMTRQLIPGRQIRLRGAGMAISQLNFTDLASSNTVMRGCICFGLATTLTAYDPDYASKAHGNTSVVNGGSDYSEVSSITIAIAGTKPANFHYGIWTAGRLFCRDVIVQNGGFKWTAGNLQSGAGSVTGNANVCLFDNCQSFLATEHGFFADGDDANACKIIGCNAYEPAGFGYRDYSLLGNAYVGCHASTVLSTNPAFASFAPNQANRSSFDGCYAEENGDPGLWSVETPGVIISPKGAMPIRDAGFNLLDTALYGTANNTWRSGNIRIASTEALAQTLGDGSNTAMELAQNMVRVRAADNILYSMVGGGGGLTFVSGVTNVAVLTAGAVDVTGRVTATTYLKSGTYTVGTLPAAATAGVMARTGVTDSNATLTAGIGAIVAGGGANIVPVVSNATNWLIG